MQDSLRVSCACVGVLSGRVRAFGRVRRGLGGYRSLLPLSRRSCSFLEKSTQVAFILSIASSGCARPGACAREWWSTGI